MLISVIIPTYNKAPFLRETVESVVQQGYQRKEILIVNDGSTDNSLEIANAIISENPNTSIAVLSKENSGISDTRNFIIKRARGELITTLDGDDLMGAGYLESVAARFSSNPGLDLVSCNVELIGQESGTWLPEPYDAFSERYNNNIPTLVTYKKNLWERIGGYDTAFAFNEDWNFFIAGEKQGMQVAKLEPTFLRYRVDAGGLAHNFIKDTWQYSVSLMMTSHSDLYPVAQVFQAHETLAQMPDRWNERFSKQKRLHPQNWLLDLWNGLFSYGKKDLKGAAELFLASANNASEREWQPQFMLGKIFESAGDIDQAKELFQVVRVRRPDAVMAFQRYFVG